MLNSDFINSFCFLGYDIRKVKQNESSSLESFAGKVSIDMSISERPDGSAFAKNLEQVSGSLLGLFPTIQLAEQAFHSLPDSDQGMHSILGVFLNKDSFGVAVTQDLIDPMDRIELKAHDINMLSLLGFDVATLQFEWISYCHNFGFDSREHLMPIPLNEVGLLDSLEMAEQVKLFAEKKVPGHRPFGIWGIARCS